MIFRLLHIASSSSYFLSFLRPSGMRHFMKVAVMQGEIPRDELFIGRADAGGQREKSDESVYLVLQRKRAQPSLIVSLDLFSTSFSPPGAKKCLARKEFDADHG